MSRPRRTELVVYAVCAVVVAVLGWRAVHSGSPPAVRAGARVATAAAVPRAPVGGGATAVVHVVGAVRRPGVYRLTTGARVQQAIQRAGGATHAADLQGVNLAAKVADAQQVIVPRRAPVTTGGPAPTGATSAGAGGTAGLPVNLNTATEADLDALPGVGPATAQKILQQRASSGGFRSVDDLANVPGIGPKKLAALREQVRV